MAASRPVRHRRRVLTVVASCLLGSLLALPATAVSTASPTAPATATAAALPVPELRWTDCGDGFQCATARVPLDYDKPRGARISLALIRLPAGDPARRIGSIFVNPGGPGTSGVGFVRRAGRLLYSREVQARFDLVGFDPRGIIRSTPLRCFNSLQQAQAAQPPFPFPVTPQQERVWIRSDRRIARACADRAGAIIDHMATANVARDLDLLRQAVGDARLSYAGYSYGSYLGTTYANLFRTRCGRCWSTASPTRSPGPPAGATRPAPSRCSTAS
jgi:pimeloyl-ACP methyl ester carboxylesterase